MAEPLRVCILGSRGLLGTELVDTLSHLHVQVEGYDLPECDITRYESVHARLHELGCSIVINAAAYTQVDMAEEEEEKAFRVNCHGAFEVARAALAVGARLIHFSTDFVFDGNRSGPPYVESDATSPQGAYGRSKAAGEEAVLSVDPSAMILRIGGLYGRYGRNFFSRMADLLRQNKRLLLDRQRKTSPTWSGSVALQVHTLLGWDGPGGVFHATCQGETTWAEFGAAICSRLGLVPSFEAVDSDRLTLPAPRPFYGVLDNQRLRAYGMDRMPHWNKALLAYLGSAVTEPSGDKPTETDLGTGVTRKEKKSEK